jgi:hypothetical protein
MYVETGETVSLGCVGIGVPDVEISWSFNGTPVINTSSMRIHEEDVVVGGTVFKQSILQISKLAEIDAGDYTCIASDFFMAANATTKISVIS